MKAAVVDNMNNTTQLSTSHIRRLQQLSSGIASRQYYRDIAR
jgi:hypothetical protein